jgi:sugar O-acyltransferase (sialic acid O-acetyltransferase NeuD family)
MSSILADGPGRLVLLGAGGHAKVVLALARAAGRAVDGVCDPALARAGTLRWREVPVLGDDDALETLDPTAVELVNGIGQIVGSDARRRVFERCKHLRFRFASLVHPSAIVDASSILDEGVQVMAGAVIQPDCRIGANTIVNTRAGVDHDCKVGAHVHVAPAATLCGGVCIEEGAFIGSGATVIPGLTVGAGAIVGAGTVLVRDLPAQGRWLGPVQP